MCGRESGVKTRKARRGMRATAEGRGTANLLDGLGGRRATLAPMIAVPASFLGVVVLVLLVVVWVLQRVLRRWSPPNVGVPAKLIALLLTLIFWSRAIRQTGSMLFEVVMNLV